MEAVRWKRPVANGSRRGLVATRAVAKGEYVIVERPSLAVQTDGNTARCLACAHCNGFAGSLLAQLAVSMRNCGRAESQAAARTATAEVDAGGAARFSNLVSLLSPLNDSAASAAAAAAAGPCTGAAVPSGAGASFAHLRDILPPEAGDDGGNDGGVAAGTGGEVWLCGEGCGAVYCSERCRSAAWKAGHCLLCCGSAQLAHTVADGGGVESDSSDGDLVE